MITYNLKVVKLKRETDDTCTISLKQPGLKKIKYLPGQYLTVIVNINGRKYRRPYSFSSSPGISSDLDITVKRVAHGLVSNHLIDMIKENDLLEVLPPLGDFCFNSDIHLSKTVYLWGAGSGITPLISILRYALSLNIDKIVLTICNKSKKDTIFYYEIVSLKQKYPSNFILNLYCTREQEDDTIKGRIDNDAVKGIYHNNGDTSFHFICGPSGLKDLIKDELINQKVKSENIYSEEFEHLASNIDLTDIETKVVTIITGGNAQLVEVVKGKSILEAALDTGIDIPYSCQTGTCHLCKAVIDTGDVKTISPDDPSKLLTKNEHLLCCSYPLTDNVVFKI